MKNLVAQIIKEPLGKIGEGEGFGPWAGVTEPGITLANILSMAIGAMTIGAGIWFLFQVIIAGYNYLSAGGDRERLVNAGRKLTNAIIGLLIVVAAYAFLAIMGTLLGVEFLEINKAISKIVGIGQP